MPVPTDPDVLGDHIRDRYAAAATGMTSGCCSTDQSTCCDATGAIVTEEQREQFGHALYTMEEQGELPEAALLASLGCGNHSRSPTCTRATPSWISAPAAGSTCCWRLSALAPPDWPMGWT